jgi:hypothetical protein
VELRNAYVYNGQTYGPGKTEVPDDILEKEDLSETFRKDINDELEDPEEGTPVGQGSDLALEHDLPPGGETRRESVEPMTYGPAYTQEGQQLNEQTDVVEGGVTEQPQEGEAQQQEASGEQQEAQQQQAQPRQRRGRRTQGTEGS